MANVLMHWDICVQVSCRYLGLPGISIVLTHLTHVIGSPFFLGVHPIKIGGRIPIET